MNITERPASQQASLPNLLQEAQRILQVIYGYTEFRLYQSEIIQALLENRDVMALMPTGGGKSLCYQIPSLIREGTGIVISPLIALMQDQVSALQQLGVRAAFINSSLTREEIHNIERSLLEGKFDIVYVAPERLLTEHTLNLLDQIRIAIFAIDEAHCVSQWGHDFRKEYQQLSKLHERFPDVPRIALTATADKRTRKEIIEQLDLEKAAIFINSFDRPNIHYAINDEPDQKQQLWRFIQEKHPNDAGIVYCLSRKKVESIASWLTEKGRTALPYHAGLDDDMRYEHQERFLREEGLIIVATIAFGMGIDKPDVRFVAHLNLPKSIEAYYQETGRAGRDGEPANAWMNYGLQDIVTMRQWLQESDADEQYKRVANGKLEAILGLCELTTCRRQALLHYFDEATNKSCGNCDNCLDPPQTWDGTVAAQKALSCVYRTGQRFGVSYIIDVLCGRADERIQRNQHDQISTFGIGNEYSNAEWRSIFRQLVARNYLDTDTDGYGSLRLTDKCRPLLRNEKQIHLRKIIKQHKSKDKSVSSTAAATKGLRACDEALYQALRELRLRIANEQGVPAYIIFPNQTLQEMARRRPGSPDEMRYISGVGQQKLSRYGNAFIKEIKAHPLPPMLNNNLSETVNDTLNEFLLGKDAEAIAQHRNLQLSTVYGHFAEAITAGLLNARDILPVEREEYESIVNAMEMLDAINTGRLKPVFEALDEQYSYGMLKCVLAGLSSQ